MTKKNTASEYSIVRRLHFLFQRALQKFKGDIQLWAAYFSFCEKSGSTKLLGKAFARAIQYHPLNAGTTPALARRVAKRYVTLPRRRSPPPDPPLTTGCTRLGWPQGCGSRRQSGSLSRTATWRRHGCSCSARSASSPTGRSCGLSTFA